MNVCKLLQKQTYSVLSHKFYVICFIFLLFTTLISFIHLCEEWLNRMITKDERSFLSYIGDNIGGISLEKGLCHYLPIDVVYTWVNGSDPLLQMQLNQYRINLKLDLSKSCPYGDCLPSHFTVFRINTDHFKTRLYYNDSIDNYIVIATNLSRNIVQKPLTTNGQQLWKLYHWKSPNEAVKQLNLLDSATNSINEENYKNLHQPHWTTDKTAPNLYSPKDFIMLKLMPRFNKKMNSKFVINKSLLNEWLGIKCVKLFWHYEKSNAIIVQLENFSDTVFQVHDDNNETKWKIIRVDSDFSINVTNIHLVLELPLDIKQTDYGPSRFDDKEELRYSLRSLEKFAPWVRKIYLVTNGQIPHWLNLENPRIIIVPHNVLFVNKSHLPTFSSPAIETHLHRIPGLSQKFLYMNDDLFVTREIWPDDFLSPQLGQKVYLSWPVPDCNSNCQWFDVGNGVCDKSCNVSACAYDNGDCNYDFDNLSHENHKLDNNNFNVHDHHQDDWNNQDIYDDTFNQNEFRNKRDTVSSLRQINYYKSLNYENKRYENSKINFISDVKNHLKCLYNVKFCRNNGRHNKFNNRSIDYTLMSYNCNLITQKYLGKYMSSNITSKMFRKILNKKIYHSVPRSIKYYSNSFKYKVVNRCVNNYLQNSSDYSNNTYRNNIRMPRSALNFQEDFRNFNLYTNRSNSSFLSNEKNYAINVEQQLRNSSSIFNKTSSKLPQQNYSVGEVDVAVNKQHEHNHDHIHHDDPDDETFGDYKLDSYAESLLHVNMIFGKIYGFKPRKVPAHMPHLIDKLIMSKLQNRFSEEYDKTSSNRVRSSDDMQVAFSYFYYLMSEQEIRPVDEIFDMFDTDQSETWSDREIRTIMTRLYPLPLHQNNIMEFEKYLKECSSNSIAEYQTQLPYERYLGSTLPLITKEIIITCDSILKLMNNTFGYRKKYQFTIVKSDQFVGFHMIKSNLNELLYTLDKIRKKPKKFLCLNDNMDPSVTKDNELIRAVLLDFYHSFFPKPSQFELPPEYRNRFLYYDEYISWKNHHSIIMSLIVFSVLLLIVIALSFVFNREISLLVRRSILFFKYNLTARRKYQSRHTYRI